MLTGTLFQDFVPEYLTDLRPYCKVYCHVIKYHSHKLALYHIDEIYKEIIH